VAKQLLLISEVAALGAYSSQVLSTLTAHLVFAVTVTRTRHRLVRMRGLCWSWNSFSAWPTPTTSTVSAGPSQRRQVQRSYQHRHHELLTQDKPEHGYAVNITCCQKLQQAIGYITCCQQLLAGSSSSAPALHAAGLAQNNYLKDKAFLNYLKYLDYWRQPQYAKYIRSAHT
jgi:hypothetical protein